MSSVLLLASASPRRRQLLATIGLPCEVQPADVVEPAPGSAPPAELVRESALLKARSVAATSRTRLVLGADTVVATAEQADSVLGKPRDIADAQRMLRSLSGRTHAVLTGVALLLGGREALAVATTRVTFEELSDDFIARYVATGEPMDKAGAYGAQGLMGTRIAGIEGSWTNVVGLPLERLPGLFAKLGEDLADWQDW